MTEPTLEVLYVPGCPHVATMVDRLSRVTRLPVTTREVRTNAAAAEVGMNGSPTLLIDGVDPFTRGDEGEVGVACRLYRDERGRAVPAPTPSQLRAALAAAGVTTSFDPCVLWTSP